MVVDSDQPRSQETILIVDGDPAVRDMFGSLLQSLGYSVLEAADGPRALKVLTSEASVDLLLTDKVLPGRLTGRQLFDDAKRVRPNLKALFTSGHAEDFVVGQGGSDSRIYFLPKPFRRQDLARKVREALDGPP
jgi:CheY-like chemotaxis protein